MDNYIVGVQVQLELSGASVTLGEDIVIGVKLYNSYNEDRTVNFTLQTCACLYTGACGANVLSVGESIKIKSGEGGNT